MDLRDYWHLLKRGWAVILVTTVACLGIGITLTALAQPEYESKAKLFVSNVEENASRAYRGGLFATSRVFSYADLVTSQRLAERVAGQLDLGQEEAASIVEDVEAEVLEGTSIVEITAQGSSPEEAQQLAQAYADQLPLLIHELETTPGSDDAPLNTTVINGATLPENPVSPVPARDLALAMALGLLLGTGIVVARDLFDSRVRTARQASDTAGAPLLGALPRRRDVSTAGLTVEEPGSSHSEAVRVLRTVVGFLDGDVAARAYLVSSPAAVESKSSTAVDLALALAEEDRSVVLVDADLRRPRAASMLAVTGDLGLTSVLTEGVDLHSALQATEGSSLVVLASGPLPPNPSELLGSTEMREIIEQLRKQFGIVIVDAPPLLPLTDAALLGPVVDGTLLVVEYGTTTAAQLRAASARLGSVRAHTSGIVLTQVPPNEPGFDFDTGPVRS